MTQRFWARWLAVIGGVFAVFGVVMAVAGSTGPFRAVFGPLIDSAFWDHGVTAEATRFQAWVYGAWGGTTAGFGLLIAFASRSIFAPERAPLRRGLIAAVTLWFVVDTGASVAYGVWGNALAVNLPAYLALMLPLALAARLPSAPAPQDTVAASGRT